jgi:hypothetical protein
LNTATTKNTARKISDDKSVAGLSWVSGRAFRKPDGVNSVSIGQLLKTTVSIRLTGKAVMFAGGEKEFYIHSPGFYRPL